MKTPLHCAGIVSLSTLICFAAGCIFHPAQSRREVVLNSPDNSIQVTVQAQGPLAYNLAIDGHKVLRSSRLGLRFRDGVELGRDVEFLDVVRESADATWENPLGKRRVVRDQHNQLRLSLRERPSGRNFDVVFRAFNDGVAFRYYLPAGAGPAQFILEEEETRFAFAGDYPCYAGQHEKKGFNGSQEWEFQPQHLSSLPTNSVVGLPLLVRTPAAWVAVTESDLFDWSGLWLARASAAKPGGDISLLSRLAPRLDGQGLVKASYPHQSPWRILMIGRKPGDLIESDLVVNLASPCQLTNTAWIEPGMMAWDRWWSGIGKVDTATFKDFIQLAAEMGWRYELIDAGWYVHTNQFGGGDITRVNPAVDMDELRRFAAEKQVGLWVWLHWTDVDRDDAYQRAFPLYEKWGIAGVKIDFMDRDDQDMVNWYEKITRAAADHHLMVDFHGAFKPTGMIRTLPNQITREGVLGNEYNKWSNRVTPEHKVTLPFTRFLAGPGDFTPGGFVNRSPDRFRFNVTPTEVQGTRAAELALFVLYDSPVCCLCDHPSHYQGQPGAEFLEIVPTVWDETRVLDGAVAEFLVMARRSGDQWFLGALTDSRPRDITIPLNFLGTGDWKLNYWHDVPGTTNTENLVEEEAVVNSSDTIGLHLSPAGGAVARLQKE